MTTSSTHLSNLELAKRRLDIMNLGDLDELDEVLDEEYTQVIPQSGEVVRGIENVRAIFENYPGAEKGFAPQMATDDLIVEPKPFDILTTTFTMSPLPGYHLIHIEDQGSSFTSYATARYPDGSEWFVVTITNVRDHKILSETLFFAPRFDPPKWRAQWVEPVSA